MQGQRNLNHACSTRRSLGVANLGFNTPQGNMLALWIALFEDFVECGHFAQVPRHSSSAVRFNQAHCRRSKSRRSIGPLKCQCLPSRTRCINTFIATVARSAQPLDDRINSIPIALCVCEALEDQHSQPLADHHPV